ncbi:MAG: beta strand repeat-containing protein, partial [Burkholderiaceae bacterium]
MKFNRNGATGKVVNEGTLTAGLGGYIALLAPEVRNSGVIVARMGTVAMAAGEVMELQFDRQGSLANVAVTPSTVAALVENGRAVQAPGGLIILSAQAANQILGGVVKNTGSLQADGITDNGGVIRLSASHTIRSSGRISADAAPGSAGKGGQVTAIADLGNAGSVTEVSGTISAKGGELGGDGGFIDTSASRLLITETANVSAASPKGQAGTWLLDPYDIIISDTLAPSGAPYSDTYSASSDTSVIPASSIQAALNAGSNVSISTGAAGSAGGQTGNIDVKSSITKSAGAATTLTLTAADQIQVDAGVTIGSTGSSPLHLEVSAGSSAGARNFAGVFSGSGTLTKSGPGTVVMTGANTYTGGTAVTAGIVKAGNATAFGTGAISVSSGAALDLNGQTMTSTGTLTLNGSGVSNSGALYNSNATKATYAGLVALGSNSSIVAGTGSIFLSNTGIITGSGFDLTLGGSQEGILAGVIGTGTGSLTKQGSGTWVLNAVSTYSGGTTLDGGVFKTNVSMLVNPFGTGTITINSGATLGGKRTSLSNPMIIAGGTLTDTDGFGSDFTGTVSLSGNLLINVNHPYKLRVSGAISGSGGIINGGSSAEVTLSGANTYTGGTTLNGGTLTLGSPDAIGSSGTISFGGGTLKYSVSNSSDYSSRFSTAASQAYKVDTNGENVTWASALTSSGGTLTKAGSGTLTLTGTNTYTGGTTVGSGAVEAGNATAFGTGAISVSSGAALDLNGQTMTSTGTLTLNGSGVSNSGALYNSNATKATYAGLVALGSNSSIVAGTGDIDLSNTGTITGSGFGLTLGGSREGVLAGAIGIGTGSLTKQDAGTWTLKTVSTYSGGTTLNGGVLRFDVDQLVNPLGTGTITVNSGATLKGYRTTMSNPLIISGGTLNDDNGFGGDYTGTVSLSGNLLIDGYFRLGISGAISGSGGIIKGGSGELVLSGANTYTGGTTINAGRLQIGSGGTSGSITGGVANSGTLAFNRSDALSFPGVISGSGAVTNVGSGTLTLTGANTYTGGTSVSAGTLRAGRVNAFGSTTGALNIDGGTVDLGSYNQTVGAITIGANGGTLTSSTGTVSATSVTQAASSTFNLSSDITTSGAQSYGGALVLGGADVALTSTAAGVSVTGGVSLSATLDILQVIQYLDGGAYRISTDGGATYSSGTLTGTPTTIGGGTLSFASNAYSFRPTYSGPINYLIVAGGGGAGNNYAAGGGAGGLLAGTTNVTSGSSYSITVGAGGAGASSGAGTSGENSTAFGLTAIGGGTGMYNGLNGAGGSTGGSGGGASANATNNNAARIGLAGTAGQGNAGGSTGGSASPYQGGGGGGAGGAGAVGAPAGTGIGG